MANQRLNAELDLAKDADRRAKEAKAKAHAIEEKMALEASHAIKDFKSLEDFKTEVGEAMFDAYLKGFAECKMNVLKAFFGLDLQGIIADARVEGDEEESEAEAEAKTS